MKRLVLAFVFLNLIVRLFAGGVLKESNLSVDSTCFLGSFQSMNDGEYYTQLVGERIIVKYDYKTGQLVDTVLDVSKIKECPIQSIQGYFYSPTETKILVYNNVSYKFGTLQVADYYVFDVKRKELESLSEMGGQEECPVFSPNGRYVVFGRKNNLYVKKLDFKTVISITKDEEGGAVSNGVADRIYHKSFNVNTSVVWSPDSKLIAYVKYDNSLVSSVQYPIYNTSARNKDLNVLVGTNSVKYTKPGEQTTKVSVCVYDDFNKSTKTIKVDKENEDYYVPKIQWTKSPDQFVVYKLNRSQNTMDVIFVNPRTTIAKLIVRQKDKCFYDLKNIEQVYFTNDNLHFFILSDQDGYRHLYQYQINGTLVKQLTKGNWDVSHFYGFKEDKQLCFLQSAEGSPSNKKIYSVDLKGRKVCLTNVSSVNDAIFNSTYTQFYCLTSDKDELQSLSLLSYNGNLIRRVKTYEQKEADKSLKEFFQLKTSDQKNLNAWIKKPSGFDQSKTYPLISIVNNYSKDESQLRKLNLDLEDCLLKQGYVVLSIQSRCSEGVGAGVRKSSYGKLGSVSATDQEELIRSLIKQYDYIDEEKIDILAYGEDAMTALLAVSKDNNIFNSVVLISPIVDWMLYDATYVERYMQMPQENYDGYQSLSPLHKINSLNNSMLLIHGTADETYLLQNTMLLAARMNDIGKAFEMHLYPDVDATYTPETTRKSLNIRVCNFLKRGL